MKDTVLKIAPWVLIGLILMGWANSCHNNKQAENRFMENLRISRDSTHHFQDKHGEEVSRNESLQLQASEIGKQFADLKIDYKKLKDQVGGLNNLVSFYKGKITASGTIVTIAHDTVFTGFSTPQKEFGWNNKFLKFDGVYNPMDDSVKGKYIYSTGIELTTYRKKKSIIVDARLEDQSATITNGQSIVIIDPPKKIYEKNWFWGAIGIVVGFTLGK